MVGIGRCPFCQTPRRYRHGWDRKVTSLSDHPEIQTWLGWEGVLSVRPSGDTDMVGVGR